MQSEIPKVLHPLANTPLLQHVLNVAKKISLLPIHIIYGHKGELIQKSINENNAETAIIWTEQKQQLGTAHALQQVVSKINPDNDILVLYADVPLITSDTLYNLIAVKKEAALTILTAKVNNPFGYGRIIRDDNNQLVKICEQKDASAKELLIDEINTGIMLLSANELIQFLAIVSNDNLQNEYYLTDIIEIASQSKLEINSFLCADADEILGVNNKVQLAQLERIYQLRQANEIMMQGVTLMDPSRFDLRGDATFANDITIDINVLMEGQCVIGNNVTIGANCYLNNVTIGDNTVIYANSHIEGATIDDNCTIGPFARIRPDSYLKSNVKIGNFVEVKKSTINIGSKVNHLSYIGDTLMGERVNIGAGTITCNYDGANKHQTILGDDVFIGSNSALVAPVELKNKVTIGAGSTIVKSVAENELSLTRSEQKNIKSWKRPQKQD